jgi:carotenoid cleavage dioxygenase-like enzyme
LGSKNQPSVNVIEWRGKLLGLSEGSLPTIVNPETFDLEGYENFGGAVPDYLTFTAHPRFDAATGDMFAWGFEKRPPGTRFIKCRKPDSIWFTTRCSRKIISSS